MTAICRWLSLQAVLLSAVSHLKEYLPKEFQDAEVIIKEMQKNDGMCLHGLALRKPGMDTCPVIYLEDYYDLYQNGVVMEDTFHRLSKNCLSSMNQANLQQNMDFIYDRVKDNLFLTVVNAEKNQKMLATVPYQKMEDLAVLYRCMMSKSDDQIGFVLVNNSLLRHWGISKEALHEQALLNMERLFTLEFHSMDYIIAEMLGIPYPEEEITQNKDGLFVLSNTQRTYGAAYLCCPDVLKSLDKKMEGNYLILPSSVHEIILLRERAEMDISDLREIVESVNQTAVRPTEYLSDNIYRFDCEKQSLSLVEDNGIQQGMKFLQ